MSFTQRRKEVTLPATSSIKHGLGSGIAEVLSIRHTTLHSGGDLDMKSPIWSIVVSLLFITSCSSESKFVHDRENTDKWVILTHTEFIGGQIKGDISCVDGKGRRGIAGSCLSSEKIMQDIVLSCGPSIVSVDKSWTHSWSVAFPLDWKPGKPSPVEVVRCIKKQIGFSFSASIGPAFKPGQPPEAGGDPRPFASL